MSRAGLALGTLALIVAPASLWAQVTTNQDQATTQNRTQVTNQNQTTTTNRNRPPIGGRQRVGANPNLITASSLIGNDVTGPQGEVLGKLEHFIFGQNGQIVYVIVCSPTPAGARTCVAIPWSEQFCAAPGQPIVLPFTSELLRQAPALQGTNFQQLNDAAFRAQLDSLFQAHLDTRPNRPTGTTPRPTPSGTVPAQPAQPAVPGNAQPKANTPGQNAGKVQAQTRVQTNTAGQGQVGTQRPVGNQATTPRMTVQGRATQRGSFQFVPSSSLIGNPVVTANSQSLGTLGDLIIDCRLGATFAIMNQQGQQGSFAVPFSALQIQPNDQGAFSTVLNLTPEQLQNVPLLQQQNFAELSDARFVQQLNRFFGVTGRQEVETQTQPGATPQQPGTTPQRPGATPQQPGATPQQPGATPQQGTQPNRTRPNAQPNQPSNPGTQPQNPTTQPRRGSQRGQGTQQPQEGTQPPRSAQTPNG